ncbi:hypothetical protein AMATHDRAFT_6683 [Amanita thiersii Skay4041]|uniref:Uncharacterized protein n=1 Tax=Amanita thiersii Skay4041 TaxID=703135 RepID=A0A2A9NIL7_9AGAR|nr:hypothetical protein AMATHDRAFT_6683 [Amanita thiersii Skay4041]
MAPEAADTRSRVWVITGTSSGFGRRLVFSALARGDRVVATARSAEKLANVMEKCPESMRKNLRTIQLDVTEGAESIKTKMRQAVEFWGHIDVLVNNAGSGYPSLVEEAGTELLRKQMEINLFGLMDVTVAALPYLRSQKSSTLIFIGSRSAWKTNLVGIGAYAASKAAVHALAETLTVELAPFGVRVLHVAPGSFRTEGIYCNGFYDQRSIPDYDEIRDTSAKRFASVPGNEKGDPDKAMEVIVDIVRSEGVAKDLSWPGLLVLGEDAEADVRNKCGKTLEVLDQWRHVSTGVSLDA